MGLTLDRNGPQVGHFSPQVHQGSSSPEAPALLAQGTRGGEVLDPLFGNLWCVLGWGRLRGHLRLSISGNSREARTAPEQVSTAETLVLPPRTPRTAVEPQTNAIREAYSSRDPLLLFCRHPRSEHFLCSENPLVVLEVEIEGSRRQSFHSVHGVDTARQPSRR